MRPGLTVKSKSNFGVILPVVNFSPLLFFSTINTIDINISKISFLSSGQIAYLDQLFGFSNVALTHLHQKL